MIKVNERFDFDRKGQGWILTEHVYGNRIENGRMKATHTTRKHYYPNIDQLISGIVERSLDGRIQELVEIKRLIRRTKTDLRAAIRRAGLEFK